MKLNLLINQTRQYPIFGVEDCQKWFPGTSRGVLLVQLTQYVKNDYLTRLRRGLYILNSEPRPHPLAIAARLRADAVITAESVLSAEGIIPETSFSVTALTAGRSTRFLLPKIGAFIFRHVEPRLLFGWRLNQYPPYAARVADIEKALLDLLWFHRGEKDTPAYLSGLRLTLPNNFSWSKFRRLAGQFNDPRLQKMAKLLERRHL